MRHLFLLVLAVTLLVSPLALRSEMTLLLAEEDGCMWCARWDSEISGIYPKTQEGVAAPLQRVDIHESLPDGITLKRPLYYTPTFVLLDNGQEVGRIEGYPGEDFFWGLLGVMLRDAGVQVETSG
jgi:thioredoxin-related protein